MVPLDWIYTGCPTSGSFTGSDSWVKHAGLSLWNCLASNNGGVGFLLCCLALPALRKAIQGISVLAPTEVSSLQALEMGGVERYIVSASLCAYGVRQTFFWGTRIEC